MIKAFSRKAYELSDLPCIIPTAADHFHYPGWNAVENRPLIGTDYPPLVSTANSAEWLSAPYGSVSVRGKLYRVHTIDYYKLYLATEMAHPGFRGAGGGVRGVRPSCPIADYGFPRCRLVAAMAGIAHQSVLTHGFAADDQPDVLDR